MAKDETKRVRPTILQEDRDAMAAIKGFKAPVAPYAPANDNYTLPKLQDAQNALVGLRENEVDREAEAAAARDATVKGEWTFHNLMLGAKDQVKAQYGDDSDQYAAMGLIKKSEREAPGRPAGAAAPKSTP